MHRANTAGIHNPVWMSQHDNHSPYIFSKSICVWLWHLATCGKECAYLCMCHVHIGCAWCTVIENEKVREHRCGGCWLAGSRVSGGFKLTVCRPCFPQYGHKRNCESEGAWLLRHSSSHTRVTTSDTIAIPSNCPCGYMALDSIIEPFSLHQFPQRTFLFHSAIGGVKIGLL